MDLPTAKQHGSGNKKQFADAVDRRQVWSRLSRPVYLIMGLPIDAITMTQLVEAIWNSVQNRDRLFLSTVNLNFLTLADQNADFREFLFKSDLCTPDGIAVTVVAKLLGIDMPERVSGSDILEAFWNSPATPDRLPLKVFFFGGTEEANQKAREAVNVRDPRRIICVGAHHGGFGSIEELSDPAIIEEINGSGADFLIVALGARKGQAWIMHNLESLKVPIVSHLGATVNFLAGTVGRAPYSWQKLGLEWLWRIKEEPQLASRYWNDFLVLTRVFLPKFMPMAISLRWNSRKRRRSTASIAVAHPTPETMEVTIDGVLSEESAHELVQMLSRANLRGMRLLIDVARMSEIDPAGMATLALMQNKLPALGVTLEINGLQPAIAQAMRRAGIQGPVWEARQK